MNEPTSRRAFLRGKFSAPAQQPRPPWARPEADFIAACSRCGDCARACPTRIIIPGDGGYPTIDFARGECTFCTACVAACQPHALLRIDGARPWSWQAGIGDACLAQHGVECRVCGEQCGESAIRFRPQLGGAARPELDRERCTGCGACVAPCPARAIAVK